MNRLICDAVSSRRLLHFGYNRIARVVEPHAHGFNENRVEVMRGYQVHGGSQSGEDIGWKFFMANRMRDIRLGSVFTRHRTGQEDASRQMIVIHCSVGDKA